MGEFALEISAPDFEEERGHFCVVSCPALRKRPFMIFGVDEEQAIELSIDFVRISLKDAKIILLDMNGQEITLPQQT